MEYNIETILENDKILLHDHYPVEIYYVHKNQFLNHLNQIQYQLNLLIKQVCLLRRNESISC